MDLAKTIGKRIRAERDRRGWTLEQLAEQTNGLTVSRISNYEQGLRKPRRDAVDQLAHAFGVSQSYIECYTDDPLDLESLTQDERALLAIYRRTDERGKKAIRSIAQSQPSQGHDDGYEEAC